MLVRTFTLLLPRYVPGFVSTLDKRYVTEVISIHPPIEEKAELAIEAVVMGVGEIRARSPSQIVTRFYYHLAKLYAESLEVAKELPK